MLAHKSIACSSNIKCFQRYSSIRHDVRCSGTCHPTASHQQQTAAANSTRPHYAITSGRPARSVCRDAPRPMWAAKEPPEDGSSLSRMITSNITCCDSITGLSDIHSEWGGSFDYINAAAAFVKYCKLQRRGAASPLLAQLSRSWLQVLPDATLRQLANVLWSCGRLNTEKQLQQVWNSTWRQYIKQIQDTMGQQTCTAQEIANSVWASAKLRKQPSAGELQLLLHAFLQPHVLGDAAPQAMSNVAWALAELCRLPGWQGGVSEEDVQQLLGEQQLQHVAAGGNVQDTTTILIALARMAEGDAPLIGVVLAQECSRQLLAMIAIHQVGKWAPQQIANTLWACGELGLADTQFMAAAMAAAPVWVPKSIGFELTQAARACARLQYGDVASSHIKFMQMLLQQGQVLLQHAALGTAVPGQLRPLNPSQKDSVAALLALSVAEADMQQLAGPARDLVTSSSIQQRPNTHPSNLSKLWLVHSWLLQHQLLDGKGLSGVLTEQQLFEGQKGAAIYNRPRRM